MALILTRRCGEVIHIGNDIEIFIAAIRKDQVSIGIEAPKGITILRHELVTNKAFDRDTLELKPK